jgi:hypothetical protein
VISTRRLSSTVSRSTSSFAAETVRCPRDKSASYPYLLHQRHVAHE